MTLSSDHFQWAGLQLFLLPKFPHNSTGCYSDALIIKLWEKYMPLSTNRYYPGTQSSPQKQRTIAIRCAYFTRFNYNFLSLIHWALNRKLPCATQIRPQMYNSNTQPYSYIKKFKYKDTRF